MLPLREIADFATTVDDGRSPIADAVAAQWGYARGEARFWRSSATHVFVVPHSESPTGRAYLRFAPDAHRSRSAVEAPARLAAELSALAIAATPVPTTDGTLVATVDTSRGPMHATLLLGARGVIIDDADLTTMTATTWGRGLAVFHLAAAGTTVQNQLSQACSVDAVNLLAEGAAVRDAADRVARDLVALPASVGVIHGDFELDNIAFDGDHVTAYDFDEAARSWHVADVEAATRDLVQGGHIRSGAEASRLFGEFLDGYREVRPLHDAELAWLPLFAAARAARWLAALPDVVADAPRASDPQWVCNLHRRLLDVGDRERQALLGFQASR